MTAPAEQLAIQRIVILGAGPAGLAAARMLHLQGLTVLVLERDPGPDARTQGGSLDLTEDGGLMAISRMGLDDAFARDARPQGQHHRVLDSDANIVL